MSRLRDRFKVMEARVRDLRYERAELVKARDEGAREAFAAMIDTAEEPMETSKYREAQAAVDRLAENECLLTKAEDEQVAVLKRMTGETGGDSCRRVRASTTQRRLDQPRAYGAPQSRRAGGAHSSCGTSTSWSKARPLEASPRPVWRSTPSHTTARPSRQRVRW